MKHLVERIVKGDKRSAAKAISIIENDDLEKRNELLNVLHQHTGHAMIIGITGPPGAGKSTLVDGLIRELRSNQKIVGVIAIDPSSPFSGGAILGDRVRMQNHATDPGVFIRSMGSRGTLGGLSKATREATKVLDALGCDVVIIETVGVGQSELEVMHIADTTAVVLHPGAGDSIQAFKAGIMEIADIFVINKSDLPNTQKLIYELEMLIDMTKKDSAWRPPILKTISTEKVGLDLLWKEINNHIQQQVKEGKLEEKRKKQVEKELTSILHDLFQAKINQYLEQDDFHLIMEQLHKKQVTPIFAAEEILKKV